MRSLGAFWPPCANFPIEDIQVIGGDAMRHMLPCLDSHSVADASMPAQAPSDFRIKQMTGNDFA